MAETAISQLSDQLTDPARDDQLIVVDASEPAVGSKTKRAELGRLIERAGGFVLPSADEQLDLALAFALVPSGAVTDLDIGGRGGGSWRLTTATGWAALPQTSTSDNTERRGHAFLTLSPAGAWTLRLSAYTLWYSSGVSRRSALAALNRLRQFDTLRFDGWTDRTGANAISAAFLLTSDPAYDAATDSFLIAMRQIRTGAVITAGHRAPAGSQYPTFGLAVGIRQQQPTPYSDAVPQPLGTADAGSSSDLSRADHVHKRPTLADLGLTTQTEARRDPQAGVSAAALGSAIGTASDSRVVAACADSTRLWVLPFNVTPNTDFYAFRLDTGARDSDADIDISPGSGSTIPGGPTEDAGAACDGTHIWLGTGGHLGGVMRCWTVAGARVPGLDFTPRNRSDTITAACTDGTHIWVAIHAEPVIRAFRINSGSAPTRDAAADIARSTLGLHVNTRTDGLATDGDTLWISFFDGDQVTAYDIGRGAADQARSLSGLVRPDRARGMVLAGGRLYVAGVHGDGIQAFRFVNVVIES